MGHHSSVVDEVLGRDAGPAEDALDRQEGNRGPVEATRYATEQDTLQWRRKHRPNGEVFDHRAGCKGNRAKAVKPAAARPAGSGKLSVFAVVPLGGTVMHTVIGNIGIGEAMHGFAAMAEGHDCRRRYQAKGGKDGNCHRDAEPKPDPKRFQHVPSLVPQADGRKPADSKYPGFPDGVLINAPCARYRCMQSFV